MKTVGVRFAECDKIYSYFCDEDVEVNDIVVVQANEFLAVARVARVDNGFFNAAATKVVVQKIAIDRVIELTSKVKVAKDNEKAKILLREKINKILEAQDELAYLERAAEGSPEIRALVEEYKKIM